MSVTKDEITPFLRSLPVKVDKALEVGFEKWLTKVVNKMRDRVPVDTGTLMNSIKWYKVGDEYYLEAGNERVDYATFIEYGTYKLRANPFFNPTLNEMEDELIELIGKEMDKIR